MAVKPGDGICRAIDQTVTDRQLDRGSEIGKVPIAPRRAFRDGLPYRCLQAGEGEIATGAPLERPGQREPLRVAAMGGLRDGGSAGIAEPEQLRSLVEGLAGGIIAACAEHAIFPNPGAHHELRVTAGNQQQQIRKRDAVREPGGQGMRLQVIDRSKRLLRCPGHPLRGHRADDEAPDQPGASRGGNAVELVDANPGLVERAADQLFDMIEMGPRGDLRHDTAIRLVLGQLCADQIGADVRLRGVANDRRGGLVTAGFNAEDDHQTQMAPLGPPGKPRKRGGALGPGRACAQVGSTAAS